MREQKERGWFWWLGWEDFVRLDMALTALQANMGMGAGELEVRLIVIERQPFFEGLGAMAFLAGLGGILLGKLLRMDILVT
jgi:hypothetical protein